MSVPQPRSPHVAVSPLVSAARRGGCCARQRQAHQTRVVVQDRGYTSICNSHMRLLRRSTRPLAPGYRQ